MKKNANIVAIVFAALSIISVSYSVSLAQSNNNTNVDYKQLFEKASDKQRVTLVRNLVQERKQITYSLMKGLDSKDMDVKYYSATVLGLYRCTNATGKLADMITLEDPQFHGRLWFWGQYPAMDALIMIGNDSLDVLEINLATSDDPKVRDLSLQAIEYIEKDLHVTKAELNF